MDYIDQFKKQRKGKKLTQVQVSEMLGVSPATYGMYETRQRKMDVETFAKLCKFFGVSADELLGL